MDTETQAPDPDEAMRKAFRHWMQRLRQRMGMNQRQFAKRTRIHWVTISNWERGTQIPHDMHRRMLNIYARDVNLEPMPPLPKIVYGPPKGSTYRKRGREEECGEGGALTSHPTPQTAAPQASNNAAE